MAYQKRNISLQNFLTIGPYEEDSHFREVLELLARRGILIMGMLAVIAVTIYVLANIIFVKTVVWSYADINPSRQIVLWDKMLIFFLGVLCIAGSHFNLSLKVSRILVGVAVCIASFSMLLDDIAGGDINLAPAYISFVLMVAAGLMPYRGWQTALLNTLVIVMAVAAIYFAPLFLGLPDLSFIVSHAIYLVMVMVLLTGISSQIYLNRYDQYRAQREAEELGSQLEERIQMVTSMKEQIEEQAVKLIENEKLKDRFFANISHEFRTPLTLILGPLEDAMHKDNDSAPIRMNREELELMHKNGRNLLKLINQLLELSKIDAGRINLEIQEFDLMELIDDVMLSFVPLAETKNIDLQWPRTDHQFNVTGDPGHLEHAVSNLISNAIKFTGIGGSVSISLINTDSREHVKLKVSDTGVGIPEDELPFLFDRFYQVSQNRSINQKGTGIGLSLAKEIVELHGGTINVRSEVGEGSEFIISLPQVVEKEVRTEVYKSDPSTLRDEKLSTDNSSAEEYYARENGKNIPTILVIDDNPDILDYLVLILSERYNVVATQKSSQALELARNKNVGLIISDIMMPAPDGFEICESIKKNPDTNHIPVILLTARASDENRLHGLELGADDYISKPFNSEELMARVENLIEIRQILKDKYTDEIQIKGDEIDVSSEDARFLKEVQEVIEKHMSDSNFNVDWLASEVYLSSRQLQRKLQSITNLSAGGYIRMMRLERAAQLLAQEWGNISETAMKVGFRDPKYFSRLFKQTFGMPPSEFADKAN